MLWLTDVQCLPEERHSLFYPWVHATDKVLCFFILRHYLRFQMCYCFYGAWNCEKLKRSPWGRCPWRHTGSSFRAVAYRRCDALGRDTEDKVWTAFRCAVGKGHVHILVGLTWTSTSHPGVSGIRGNKATLPPSGVDGLLFRLLGQLVVVPRQVLIAA